MILTCRWFVIALCATGFEDTSNWHEFGCIFQILIILISYVSNMQISVLGSGVDTVSDQNPQVLRFESRRYLILLCPFSKFNRIGSA